jgi:hypothetical protein
MSSTHIDLRDPNTAKTLYDTFRALHECELAVSELYAVCSRIWSADREFWEKTSNEEKKHADYLVGLSNLVAGSPESFSINMLPDIRAIEGFADSIRRNRILFEKDSISGGKMLMFIKDIETSVLELKYAEIVKTDDQRYIEIIEEILDETRKHSEEVTARIEEYDFENDTI